MATQIVFGSEARSHILEELEDLRKEKKVDQLLDRARKPDSNVLLFEEVMNCITKGPRSTMANKDLLQALNAALNRGVHCPKPVRSKVDGASTPESLFAEQLDRSEPIVEDDRHLEYELKLDPSRLLGRFLFVEDVLPGNAKAESLCTSTDGSMLAYSTKAAVPLEAVQNRYIRHSLHREQENSLHDATRQPTALPQIVNVVSLDPYDTWTLSINSILPDLGMASLKLLGLDKNHLYAIYRNAREYLTDIGVRDGVLQKSHDLGDHCSAVFLDGEGKSCIFIDSNSKTLNCLSLSDDTRRSYPLSLPSGLSAKDLSTIEFTPDGTAGVILVSPRSESSEFLIALVVLPRGVDDHAHKFTIRWLRRKEVWLDGGFEKVRFSPNCIPANGVADAGAFYFIDATTTIYTLSVTALIRQRLEDIDPAHLFSAFSTSKGSKKASFAAMTTGSERPILASYNMTTQQIRIWDTSAGCLLMSLTCPFQVDRLELVAHDSLLIAKSRSVRGTRDRLAVTFLDFLFLMGQAPENLNNECIPLLDPLEEWAPGNDLLDFVRRLAIFNSEHAKEAST